MNLGNYKNIDKGFSNIANKYEELDQTSSLISWMRKRVRTHLKKDLKTKKTILEINCGSGIDAVYLVKKGHKVHATDIANGMLLHVKTKINSDNLQGNLSCEKLSFTELSKLQNKYHHIFSNFGGLNCSSLTDLETVFNSFNNLLYPKGKITLVIMPKICIWELLTFLKGNKNAFRRLKKNGVLANIEGEKVRTFYHSKKQIKNLLSKKFTDFKVENICFFGPTGNRVDYPEKHPKLFKIFAFFDKLSNKIPFLKGYGDYYIITATKK